MASQPPPPAPTGVDAVVTRIEAERNGRSIPIYWAISSKCCPPGCGEPCPEGRWGCRATGWWWH